MIRFCVEILAEFSPEILEANGGPLQNIQIEKLKAKPDPDTNGAVYYVLYSHRINKKLEAYKKIEDFHKLFPPSLALTIKNYQDFKGEILFYKGWDYIKYFYDFSESLSDPKFVELCRACHCPENFEDSPTISSSQPAAIRWMLASTNLKRIAELEGLIKDEEIARFIFGNRFVSSICLAPRLCDSIEMMCLTNNPDDLLFTSDRLLSSELEILIFGKCMEVGKFYRKGRGLKVLETTEDKFKITRHIIKKDFLNSLLKI